MHLKFCHSQPPQSKSTHVDAPVPEHDLGKDDQMGSPSLLSGSKICKAYFVASNRKMLLHRPPLESDFKGGHLDSIFRFEASK